MAGRSHGPRRRRPNDDQRTRSRGSTRPRSPASRSSAGSPGASSLPARAPALAPWPWPAVRRRRPAAGPRAAPAHRLPAAAPPPAATRSTSPPGRTTTARRSSTRSRRAPASRSTSAVYGSTEEMEAKIRAGNSGIDVVVPSNYAIEGWVADRLIEPHRLREAARLRSRGLERPVHGPGVRQGQHPLDPEELGHDRHRLPQLQGDRGRHDLEAVLRGRRDDLRGQDADRRPPDQLVRLGGGGDGLLAQHDRSRPRWPRSRRCSRRSSRSCSPSVATSSRRCARSTRGCPSPGPATASRSAATTRTPATSSPTDGGELWIDSYTVAADAPHQDARLRVPGLHPQPEQAARGDGVLPVPARQRQGDGAADPPRSRTTRSSTRPPTRWRSSSTPSTPRTTAPSAPRPGPASRRPPEARRRDGGQSGGGRLGPRRATGLAALLVLPAGAVVRRLPASRRSWCWSSCRSASGRRTAATLPAFTLEQYANLADPVHAAHQHARAGVAGHGPVPARRAIPLAYVLAPRCGGAWKLVLMALVVVPLWTSFLIRTYAWMFILGANGVPRLLERFGFGDVQLLNTPFAVLARASSTTTCRSWSCRSSSASSGSTGRSSRRRATWAPARRDVPPGRSCRWRRPGICQRHACSCSSRSWASTSSRSCSAAARPTSWATPWPTCSCRSRNWPFGVGAGDRVRGRHARASSACTWLTRRLVRSGREASLL